jgi:hypothetical protein
MRMIFAEVSVGTHVTRITARSLKQNPRLIPGQHWTSAQCRCVAAVRRTLPGGRFLAANAKQLKRPVFQAGPNGCKSRRGYQFLHPQGCILDHFVFTSNGSVHILHHLSGVKVDFPTDGSHTLHLNSVDLEWSKRFCCVLEPRCSKKDRSSLQRIALIGGH